MVLFCLMLFVIADFAAAILYTITSPTSSCRGYTMNPGTFCAVAGLTSAALFVIGGYAWWRGERRQLTRRPHISRHGHKTKPVKEDKPTCDSYTNLVICVSFWNILWAIFGVYVYVIEMSWECRLEPVAIIMFLWSTMQVTSHRNL